MRSLKNIIDRNSVLPGRVFSLYQLRYNYSDVADIVYLITPEDSSGGSRISQTEGVPPIPEVGVKTYYLTYFY